MARATAFIERHELRLVRLLGMMPVFGFALMTACS
jgi:hypothetical protein